MGATPKDEIDRQHKLAMGIIHNKKSNSNNKSCCSETNSRDGGGGNHDDDSSSSSCIPMITKDEIPLIWKKIPTVEDPMYQSIYGIHGSNRDFDPIRTAGKEEDSTPSPSQYSKGSCIATRGIANVDNIAAIIQEGSQQSFTPNYTNPKALQKAKSSHVVPPPETNLWNTINAKKNNVHITRPSHDAWGIQKIILMFCDDFLQTVYEMPYFHSAKYKHVRDAMQPIIDVLDIHPNQIVRMLFASLPPGVTIPVHHDTGEWVKHTHRVHVPIIVDNPNHILFQCGPTEASLQRVNCTPGHVFEMNNQAKHAVSNCSTTNHYRVHLILDYVDPDFHIKNRIQLKPGETIIQSRRSIDRSLDAGKTQTPSFMILGVQKCGTTSLYEYINQHPLVINAKRRETHCFDWRWNSKLKTTQAHKDHCLSFFYAKELHEYPSLMTGDSTPSYLLDSYRVIPRIKRVFHHLEHWKNIFFIVMLRNPTKRAQSHYEMVTSADGTEAQLKTRGIEYRSKTIEKVIEDEFRIMARCGLIPYWDIETKTIDMDTFKSFVGSSEEDEAFTLYLKNHVKMNTGSHSIIVRGMYELQLRQWMRVFRKQQFLVITLESMSNSSPLSIGVQATMDNVWGHLQLPPYKIVDEEAKNTRAYKKEMSQSTKEMLDMFFKPHNDRLGNLVGANLEKNPWP
jgi:hypothetical protein